MNHCGGAFGSFGYMSLASGVLSGNFGVTLGLRLAHKGKFGIASGRC